MADGEETEIWKWLIATATGVFTAGATSHMKVRDKVARLERGHEEIRKQTGTYAETRDTVIRLDQKLTNLEGELREGGKRLEADISNLSQEAKSQAKASVEIRRLLEKVERAFKL